MNSLISALILATCIAGLLVVLIDIATKMIAFIGKAIVNERCSVSIIGELVFTFIFSFVIALFFLM